MRLLGASAEVVHEHVYVADWLEPEPLEDRAGHRAALGDQHRCAPRDGVVPAGADERAVGAATAGAGSVAPP